MVVVQTFGAGKIPSAANTERLGLILEEITSAESFRDNREWFD